MATPYILLNGFLLGSALFISRFGLTQWSTIDFVGLQISLAALFSLGIYQLSPRRHLPRQPMFWLRVSVWGVFGTAVPSLLVVSSLQYQSSGMTALLVATGPVMAGVLAHFVLSDERLTSQRIFGILLALSGTVILLATGESGLLDQTIRWRGPILALIGAATSAAGVVYVRRSLRSCDVYDLACARLVTAAPLALVAALLTDGINLSSVRLVGISSLLYAVLTGMVGGTIVTAFIIRRFGANHQMQTTYIMPLVAGIGGLLFLNERITGAMIVSTTLILTSIWLTNSSS